MYLLVCSFALPHVRLKLFVHNFHFYSLALGQFSCNWKEKENDEERMKGNAEGKIPGKGTNFVISDSFRLILFGCVPKKTIPVQQVVRSYTSTPAARFSITHLHTLILGGIS